MANTFHVSLYVDDIDAAVAEYQRIFGIAPAKVRPGYAKFELADPLTGQSQRVMAAMLKERKIARVIADRLSTVD